MDTYVVLLRQFIRLLIQEDSSKLGVKNKSVHLSSNDALADELEPELIDMIKQSYEKLGGHPKISEPGSLKRSYDSWVAADVDEDPEADVVAVGKNTGGNVKLGAVATDGGGNAKSYLLKLKNDILRHGWWGEVSGAIAHMAINKLNIVPIEDEKIVRKLLNKDIEWLGEHPEGKFPGTRGWYRREIGGVMHEKIIVGDV